MPKTLDASNPKVCRYPI